MITSRLSQKQIISYYISFPNIKTKAENIKIHFMKSVPALSSVAQSCLTLCNPMNWSMPGLPEFKLMPIESVMPSSHLILCCPLLLLPSIPPSIRVFSNESTLCIRWPKYWSFSFSISPSNEHTGLISFRMDWLDLLAVQATLKSLLQHHSSNAPILLRLAFFIHLQKDVLVVSKFWQLWQLSIELL